MRLHFQTLVILFMQNRTCTGLEVLNHATPQNHLWCHTWVQWGVFNILPKPLKRLIFGNFCFGPFVIQLPENIFHAFCSTKMLSSWLWNNASMMNSSKNFYCMQQHYGGLSTKSCWTYENIINFVIVLKIFSLLQNVSATH
jgi:hypothetical protein